VNEDPDLLRPLAGISVVEFEGIGPGPMAGRMLADMGAAVTVIARPQGIALAQRLRGEGGDPLQHGKQRLVLDLRDPPGLARAREQIAAANALIEGFRPGVMERLGLGPQDCAALNPALVYGRMTGWGQTGPLAQAAGHDLNYVALSGLLSLSARPGEVPIIPPTVIGDAAGALGLAFGIACALLDARRGGQGRVVDAAIVDIAAMLGMLASSLNASGELGGARPSVFHGSAFYECYRCADGKFISLGALEPQFHAELLARLGLDPIDPAAQYCRADWPAQRERFTALFLTRSRAEWCALLEGSDACFAPVLSLDEAAVHPHNLARGTHRRDAAGQIVTAPAPRIHPL
jgi:alpha-methylacyl-CoA racemase